MEKSYRTSGTCSRMIHITAEDGIIKSVKFDGGCHGNTQGVAALATGRPITEVIGLLKGIRCGGKPTSCPDQLARALESMLEEQ